MEDINVRRVQDIYTCLQKQEKTLVCKTYASDIGQNSVLWQAETRQAGTSGREIRCTGIGFDVMHQL